MISLLVLIIILQIIFFFCYMRDLYVIRQNFYSKMKQLLDLSQGSYNLISYQMEKPQKIEEDIKKINILLESIHEEIRGR